MSDNFFANQLKKAILESGKKQIEIADILQVKQEQVSRWANGKQIPTTENIKRIAEIFNKPISYFLETEEFAPSVQAVPLTKSNTIQLPILADCPAGLPEFSDRDVEMFVDIPRWLFPQADFIVKCIGDSLEPKIHKGDFCVIRKTQEPLDNRAMLVRTENGICMKVIKKLKDKVKLCSTNKKYKPFTPSEFSVIGLIIGHWSRDDKEHWE